MDVRPHSHWKILVTILLSHLFPASFRNLFQKLQNLAWAVGLWSPFAPVWLSFDPYRFVKTSHISSHIYPWPAARQFLSVPRTWSRKFRFNTAAKKLWTCPVPKVRAKPASQLCIVSLPLGSWLLHRLSQRLARELIRTVILMHASPGYHWYAEC